MKCAGHLSHHHVNIRHHLPSMSPTKAKVFMRFLHDMTCLSVTRLRFSS